MKKLTIAISLLFIISCAEPEKPTTPVYTVVAKPFSINIRGFGEIEATETQKIFSPGRRPMTLSWLREENTRVNKGDIIARFDATQIQRALLEEEYDYLLIEQDRLINDANQQEREKSIVADRTFVDYEFDFTSRFAIDDLRVYSQLEIVDTFANLDFLKAKDSFLDWKKSSIDKQHSSQLAILNIRKLSIDTKLKQIKQALSSLEVVSEFTGLLIFEKDNRGEKPSVGQTIFPGRSIAHIPNLSDMQARVFVRANEAIDLQNGQSVDIQLQAFPDRSFVGEVKQVTSFPRSIERGSPVTYIELLVSIIDQDQNKMQPGRKLNVVINVKSPSNELVVPLQALHHNGQKTFVYLRKNNEFVEQEITFGKKNQYFVEIKNGLEEGSVIALSKPRTSLIKRAKL